jgi:glycolate oxidase
VGLAASTVVSHECGVQPRSDTALVELSRVLPSDALLTEESELAPYASDASEAAPVLPLAVAKVANTAEISAVMGVCNARGVPVTSRGAGTSRVGGAVPSEGGLVLSFERMNRVKHVDPEDRLAVVEPGLVTGELHRAVESVGAFFPPDPNSWESCTIGGNVATNAGGPRALGYGVTRDYVLGLEAVTADGTVLRVGRKTRKGVTGYDLVSLLCGSEGTLAVVSEVTVRVIPKPQAIGTLVIVLDDEAAVHPCLVALRSNGIAMRCAELLDSHTLALVRPTAGLALPENARALLVVEVDGDASRVEAAVERAGNVALEAGALDVLVATEGTRREALWKSRRDLSHALRRAARKKLSEDVVVPESKLGELIAFCRRATERTAVKMPAYGHAGDGNLHVNLLWDDPELDVEPSVRSLFEETIRLGGTLSGEHGIGLSKAPYLSLEQSPAVIALERRIKDAFDPRGILNPGKIFASDATLRHGIC